jgi:hypothetical protein
MKNLYWAGILILICMVSGCLKDRHFTVDIWPKPHPNPDKFECYINGLDYIPDEGSEKIIGISNVTANINYINGFRSIIIATVFNVPGRLPRYVDMCLKNVTDTGFYEFNNLPYQNGVYQYNSNGYLAYKPGQGGITITKFDSVQNVLQGTFWFNAVNAHNPLDSVKVTGGHFNITDASFR